MNHSIKTYILPITAIIGLLILISWYAGFFSEKILPGKEVATVQNTSAKLEVTRVQQQMWESIPATIKAKQATVVSSRILATIEKINVRAGDRVTKGQLLVALEKNDLQSRSSQAQAKINSVNARLREAKLNLKRAQELIDKKLIAKADFDRALATQDALLADLDSATQALREANATLDFATITAPINGIIVNRFAEPGDTIQAGMPLISIYNPLSLRVEAHVREKIAVSLSPGQMLKVSISSLDLDLNAEIEEIVPAGNPGSRSFLTKSRIQLIQNLMPGMYAKLQIPTHMESILAIPSDYVVKVGQLDIVWLGNDTNIERRFIKTGKLLDMGLIEVISGLSEGEYLLPPQANVLSDP